MKTKIIGTLKLSNVCTRQKGKTNFLDTEPKFKALFARPRDNRSVGMSNLKVMRANTISYFFLTSLDFEATEVCHQQKVRSTRKKFEAEVSRNTTLGKSCSRCSAPKQIRNF